MNDEEKPFWLEIIEYVVGLIALAAVIFYGSEVVLKVIVEKTPAKFEHAIVEMIDDEEFQTSFYYIKAEVKLQSFVDELAASLPGAHEKYTIRVIDQENLALLILPGNTIVLSSGLINELTSENELAFLLGNALGHINNRSHLLALGRGSVWAYCVSSVLGAHNSVGQFLRSKVVLTKARFSLKTEMKADLIALKLIQQKYQNSSGVVDLLKRFEKNQAQPIYQEFMMAHPVSLDRIEALRLEVLNIGNKQGPPVILDPVFTNKLGS